MNYSIHLSRIAFLEEENEKLRQQVELYKPKVAEAIPAGTFGLTKSEAKLLSFVVSRTIARREECFAHLYSSAVREPDSTKVIDVMISKCRKKLRPWQIDIETVWATGYRMNQDNKARLHNILVTPA